MARHYEWEDYFFPGTGVLANKLGITDPVELRSIEYRLTARRELELARGDVVLDRGFGIEHFQQVHAHLFQDLYEWAGELRTVDMGKSGVHFAPTTEVENILGHAAAFANAADLRAASRPDFLEVVAKWHTAVNLAHPFREGNGRTTRAVLSDFTEASPFRLDFNRIEKVRWDIANERSFQKAPPEGKRDFAALVPVLDQMTVARTVIDADGADLTAAPSVAQLLAAARGPETQGAETPDPLRYEQLPDLGQSTDVGRDQGLER